jgi:hypothetical protein
MLLEPDRRTFPANHALRVVTLAERWNISDLEQREGAWLRAACRDRPASPARGASSWCRRQRSSRELILKGKRAVSIA